MVMLIAHISVGESLGKAGVGDVDPFVHPSAHSVRAGARLTSGVTSAVRPWAGRSLVETPRDRLPEGHIGAPQARYLLGTVVGGSR